MAGLALKQHRWAPGPDALINWSHPLAHGLSDFYVWDGATFVCLVKGDRMTRQSGLASSTTALGRSGSSSGSANSGAYRQMTSSTIGTYPTTFTWVGQSLGAPAGNGVALMAITAQSPTLSADVVPYLWGLDRAATTGEVRMFDPSGASYTGFTTGTALTTGALSVVVGVTDNNDQRLYQNGVRTVSATAARSDPTITDPYLCISTYLDFRTPAERSTVAMLHRRALTAGEAAALYADPFCMLRT